MGKAVSKTILVRFLYDFIIILTSTLFFFHNLELSLRHFVILSVLFIVTNITVLYLKGNYKIREFNISLKNSYLLLEGILLASVPIILILLSLNVNNFLLLKNISLNIISIFLLLAIYRILFHLYLFKIKTPKKVLIVGLGENAKRIADEIKNKKALKMEVAGFIPYTSQNEENVITDDIVELSDKLNLKQFIKENSISILIIAVKNYLNDECMTEIIKSVPRKVQVFKMAEFYEKITGRYFIDKTSVNSLLYYYLNNGSFIYDFNKRNYDIIASSIILICTLPILLYIAIRIKLTDGGSPLYTQERVGRYGKIFKMYKLRTMYENDFVPKNNKQIGYSENQETDDRVIPWCKWVRKARFDELPQMINILKGDMSIVGPRAEWKNLVEIYEKQIPYYSCRQWVNIGWTGWAQINQGHCVQKDDISEKLSYDLYYIKHRNLLWEIGILVKAVFMALGGRHG